MMHINIRIAETNFVFPLVRNMFSRFRGSKGKVLLVTNLKAAF